MEALRVFSVLALCACAATQEARSAFDTAGIVASNGYPSETHHVTTSDGYILEMHRIPHGIGQSPSSNRPVVFLMHGLMAASNSFIIIGPELAPAYNLADAGFDIWLGNARGNRNSRFHVSLDPDHPVEKFEFFDFSFEEIGMIDLPTMINYVLQYTGHEKLHYIGHSQGGTAFLILNSMLPEYNDKIQSAHLWAGVGYMDYFPNPFLSTLATFTDTIYSLALRIGFIEILPPGLFESLSGAARISNCTGDEKTSYMCELIGLRHLMGDDAPADDEGNIIINLEIAGASIKQIAHFGQHIRDKAFRRWSYGAIQNLNVYGSINPPIYDLSLITINTTMHYTVSDNLLDERDVLAMAADMPNTSVRKVARESFLHADFVFAADAKELVTDYIIEALRRDAGLGDSENNEELQNSEQVIGAPATDAAYHVVLNNIFKMYLILQSICLFSSL